MVKIKREALWRSFCRGGDAAHLSNLAQRFQPNDIVRTINAHAPGHTRLPGYVRDKVGVVVRYCGVFKFADDFAEGRQSFQHVYSVKFDGLTLWGADAEIGTSVIIEMYDNYLEPHHGA